MSNTLTVLVAERDKFRSAADALDEAIRVLTTLGTNGASASTVAVGEGGEVSLVPTKRRGKGTSKAKTKTASTGRTRGKRVRTGDAVGIIAGSMSDGLHTVTEIAALTELSVPSVRRVVKTMEADGLLVQSDKRGKEILYSLTEQGATKASEANANAEAEAAADAQADADATEDTGQEDASPDDEPAVDVETSVSFGGDETATTDESEVSFPTA